MTSFSSLLSSISGQSAPSQPRPAAPKKPTGAPSAANSPVLSNGVTPTANNVAAGVKRKSEEQATTGGTKVVKTESKVPVRPSGQVNPQNAAAKATPEAVAPAAPYRGTARPTGAANSTRAPVKPGPKTETTAVQSVAAPSTATDKPKRGFASILEKAKAAQEAAKAAGSSTIKHKPTEKATKRERARAAEEAAAKQKAGLKTGKLGLNDRSRSGTPDDTKGASQRRSSQSASKSIMKKSIERQQYTYKGTMNKANSGSAQAKQPAKKLAQDKYGGYASWSDLDDAEDEEGYGSDASSDMMDAGFDDMQREETEALRAARKEDQEALEEEERHRREKLERKRKLQALSKSAAARKKF